MKFTKSFFAFAVLAMACAFVFCAVPGADADDQAEDRYYVVSYDGILDKGVAGAVFADSAEIYYVTDLDPEVTVSLANMSLYESIKGYIEAGKIVVPVDDYTGDVIDAVKEFGTGETYTLVKVPAVMEKDVTIAMYSEETAAALALAVMALQAQVDDLTAQVQALSEGSEAAVQELQAQIDTLAAEKAALTKTVADRDTYIAEQKQKVADLETQVAEKDQQIQDLTKADKPIWESVWFMCAVIIAVFLIIAVVWIYRDAIKAKLPFGGKQ